MCTFRNDAKHHCPTHSLALSVSAHSLSFTCITCLHTSNAHAPLTSRSRKHKPQVHSSSATMPAVYTPAYRDNVHSSYLHVHNVHSSYLHVRTPEYIPKSPRRLNTHRNQQTLYKWAFNVYYRYICTHLMYSIHYNPLYMLIFHAHTLLTPFLCMFHVNIPHYFIVSMFISCVPI